MRKLTRRLAVPSAVALAVDFGALILTARSANAAPATATFTKVSDWGSGFTGQCAITNVGSSAVDGWTLEFDLPAGTWPKKSEAERKRMLGVSPMIGRNFNGKIFTRAHARQWVSWASTNHIGLLAFWSVGRDNGGCPGGAVSPTCSSISQSTYEFTNIVKGFRG